MRRYVLSILILALVCVMPAGVLAQDEYDADGMGSEPVEDEELGEEEAVDAPTDDARGVETYWGTEDLNEVEKGAYMDIRFGYQHLMVDGFGTDAEGGFQTGLGFGYDITEKLVSIQFDLLFSFHKYDIVNPADMGEAGATNDAFLAGDFFCLKMPLAVNLNYYHTKRFEAFASPVLGAALFNNANIASDAKKTAADKGVSETEFDAFGGARFGVEYYTGLRHFSIGIDLEVDYFFLTSSLGLAVNPMLKYTF